MPAWKREEHVKHHNQRLITLPKLREYKCRDTTPPQSRKHVTLFPLLLGVQDSDSRNQTFPQKRNFRIAKIAFQRSFRWAAHTSAESKQKLLHASNRIPNISFYRSTSSIQKLSLPLWRKTRENTSLLMKAHTLKPADPLLIIGLLTTVKLASSANRIYWATIWLTPSFMSKQVAAFLNYQMMKSDGATGVKTTIVSHRLATSPST